MITKFKITDHKAIKLADCIDVPKIMIIYGQNSVGKSTLLHALKEELERNIENNDVILISPSHAYESSPRIAWMLNQLEITRRNIISTLTSHKDKTNCYLDAANVYEPLNKLLNIMLPYLKFERVEIANWVAPRCVFSRINNSNCSTHMEITLDGLTSGEIQVISLFLPLLEVQIRRKLSAFDCRDTIMLMDMPSVFLLEQQSHNML